MIPTTRLLATVSVVGAVVCRNVHVGTLRQEQKIYHMTDTLLGHLPLRKLCKSPPPLTEAHYSTYINLINSMMSSATDREAKRTVIEPFLDSRQMEKNRSTDPYESSGNTTENIISIDDKSIKSIPRASLELNMTSGGRHKRKKSTSRDMYKSIRKWRQFRKVTPTTPPSPPPRVNSDNHFILRLLSYNILAQNLLDDHFYLYHRHDNDALDWETRKKLLLQEILEAGANVICLQEMQVDHLEEFVSAFTSIGFDYLYKKRTNDKLDGLLLLYKANQLKLIDHAKVELFQPGVDILNRDNVAIVAKFSLVDSPDTRIVISTTHLLYNPNRSDVRLAQTQFLLAEIERIAFMENTKNGPRYYPIILSGDFNLKPHTGVYKFITESTFEYKGKARNLESTHLDGLGNSLIPPFLLITDNCQHLNVLNERLRNEKSSRQSSAMDDVGGGGGKNRDSVLSKKDGNASEMREDVDASSTTCQKVKTADGKYAKFSSGRLTHPFRFYSVYQHKNVYGHEEATTNQNAWITVDYIFFSDVEPIDKYDLPSVQECKELPTIPNSIVGSDHFCLGATFKVKKSKR